MNKILVAFASLTLALAANLGIASAHPFAEPTPPTSPTPGADNNTPGVLQGNEADVEQDADDQDEDDMDEAKADDDEDDAANATTTTTTTTMTTSKDKQGHQETPNHETEKDGESEGDD